MAIFEILKILVYCLSRDISNFISYRNKFQIIIFDVMKDKSSSDVEIEERVNSLLSRMTLEEKIGQLRAARISHLVTALAT